MPTFKHDCDACEFHGQITFDGQLMDVYHCENEIFSKDTGGSIVARFSNDGPDYLSHPIAVIKHNRDALRGMPLLQALELIEARAKYSHSTGLKLNSLSPLM